MDYSVDCDDLVFNLMCIYITFLYRAFHGGSAFDLSTQRQAL